MTRLLSLLVAMAALQDPPKQPAPVDAKKFELLGTAKGHSGRALSVSLSADGKIAATGGEDRTLKVWQVDSGKLMGQMPRFPAYVNSCAISRDGKVLAGTGGDRSVGIYDVATMKDISSYKEEAFISHVQFTEDGKGIISLTGGSITVRDVDKTHKMSVMSGSEWKQAQLTAISLDGQYVARTAITGFLQVADGGSGKVIETVDNVGMPIKLLAVENGGNHAAFSSGNTLATHLPRKKGSKDFVVKKAHDEEITAMCFSPNAKILATGDAAGVVKLWTLDPPATKKFLNGHAGKITLITFSSDGKRMATSSEDGTVKIWENEALVQTLEGHESMAVSLAVGPDKTFCVTSGVDRMIRMWSIPDGKLLHAASVAHPKALHEASALDMRPGSAGTAAYTFEAPGRKKAEEARVKWWSSSGAESGGFELLKPDEDDISVYGLRCSPAGDMVAVIAKFRKATSAEMISVRVYQASTGKLLREIEDPQSESVDFSPDGKTMILLGSTLKAVEIETGTIRDLERFASAPVKRRSPYLARFMRDGQKIVFSHDVDKIEVYDRRADKVVLKIPCSVWIRSLALGPVDGQVTVGCEDGSIRIFDLAGGPEIKVLSGHREAVTAVAYSEDGRVLVSSSLELKIWGQK